MADTRSEQKLRVFVSYSRKDMAFADRLEAALKTRGFEVLIDRQEIYAFEDWWKRIEALIRSADTVVFVLSPDAVKSDIALKEIVHAASLNKRLAPIVCRRVDDGVVPQLLRQLNFIFFEDPDRFDISVGKLADALQTDIGWIRQHTEYGEAERRWTAAGRPSGLLLHSPTLEVAEYWIASRPRGAPEPTKEIQAFVSASRKGALAARRLRRLVTASMFTMLVGIILGLVGWINQSYIAAQWRWFSTERPFVAANIWPYVLRPAAEQALKPGDSFRECAVAQAKDSCPEMIVVPAGSFIMGSMAIGEGPQHAVTIVRPFAVSKVELTFDEWDTCAAYGDCAPGVNDGSWGRGQQPVINVSWDDAKRYAAWLSKVTGQPYRLLSEAEYEYATRAGTTTTYPWGDRMGQNNANCAYCGTRWNGQRPAPVGSFAANKFGLYDMVGNVYEWVEDCFHGDYDGAPADGSAWIEGRDCKSRVVRGGSWLMTADSIRSSLRFDVPPANSGPGIGFRVGRTLSTQ